MPKMPRPKSPLEKVVDDIFARSRAVKVATTPDDILACDYVLCLDADRKTLFSDNTFADCCKCGRGVQHRPDVPDRGNLICYRCFSKLAAHRTTPMVSPLGAQLITKRRAH